MKIGFGLGIGDYKNLGGVAIDPDVQAYFDRLSVQPTPAQKLVINQWYLDLKAAVGNVQTSFDYIGLRGIASAGDSLLNFLSSNHSAAYAGGMSASDWTDGQGFTGDGISKRLLVDYNPSTEGVAYKLYDASLFCFLHDLNGSLSGTFLIGNIDNTGTYYSGNRVGTAGQQINATIGGVPAAAFTQSRLITRLSSSQIKVFNDGVADANNPISNNNTAPSFGDIPNSDMSELATTFGFGAIGFSTSTLFATAVGRNFNDTESVAVYNAFKYLYDNYIIAIPLLLISIL